MTKTVLEDAVAQMQVKYVLLTELDLEQERDAKLQLYLSLEAP